MLKTIVVPKYRYVSRFGEAVFENVPVSVDVSVDAESFVQERDRNYLAADVIDALERELVKDWLQKKLDGRLGGDELPDGLTPDEISALRAFFGINASQLATLLGLTKGTISKVLSGDLYLNETASRLCLLLTARELVAPGHVQRLIAAGGGIVDQSPAPEFDFKKQRA